MATTRYNKILHTWKKLKTKQTKNKIKMKLKENKEKTSIALESKKYEELGYNSSLCKESRFEPFTG